MSKIKNGGLDHYGTGPFAQQQFETAGDEGVNGTSAHNRTFSALNSLLRCDYSRCKWSITRRDKKDEVKPRLFNHNEM